METCFNYCDKDVAFFSSDERRWITKIRKLKKRFPDKITILAKPETNDGCIYCKLPASALKIQLHEKRTMSEEQRQANAERLVKAREEKASRS